VSEVEEWRARCDASQLPAIDALRDIAAQAGPGLVESIKWNAPSYSDDGEDRITLGLERKGGVRVVLHRGAAKRQDTFAFDDPDKLARWPTPDRGMLTFKHESEIEAKRLQLTALFARWLEATR